MTQIYSQVVERYARLFDRPEARLRFLNNTLAKQATRQEELRQSLHRFRFLENTRFYDWIVEARLYSAILEEMRTLMTTVPASRRRSTASRSRKKAGARTRPRKSPSRST